METSLLWRSVLLEKINVCQITEKATVLIFFDRNAYSHCLPCRPVFEPIINRWAIIWAHAPHREFWRAATGQVSAPLPPAITHQTSICEMGLQVGWGREAGVGTAGSFNRGSSARAPATTSTFKPPFYPEDVLWQMPRAPAGTFRQCAQLMLACARSASGTRGRNWSKLQMGPGCACPPSMM